jgi:ABC-2 type transport system ATP-binding protein
VDTVIAISDLCKSYGGRPAVDHLNLAVPGGAIYALLGENGAGKSTTIRMLTGLLPQDSGKASILGQDCWKNAIKLRTDVGYVPERPRFYDWMTVSEIGWFTSGFHKPGYQANYQSLLQKFQLSPRAKLQSLSKGEYAKVGLALALAIDPKVLILDEPTSGLDLVVRREFLQQMVAMAGDGRTILIASHQIAEVERIASHVAFLSHGRLLLAVTMEELRQRLVRLRLRFEDRAPDPTRLGRVLQRNGTGKLWQAVIFDPNREALEELRRTAGVSDFEETVLSLEDVYLALLHQKEERP